MSMFDDDEPTGAIDTADTPSPPISTDNSQGQAPVQGTNAPANQMPNMGDPPFAQTEAQETPGQMGSNMAATAGQQISDSAQKVANGPVGSVAKRIASYVMGADGDPAAAINGAQQVKAQNPGMSDSDAAVLSVANTAATKGNDAAAKELLGHIGAYNAKISFAKAAMDGVQGKPPDINAAVDAANKAQMHLLDGSDVHFQVGQGGITATVKMSGTSQLQRIPLSTDQFKKLVDVGGDGQWDKMMEKGSMASIANAARVQASVNPSRAAPSPGGAGGPAATTPKRDVDEDGVEARNAFGETANDRAPGGARSFMPGRSGSYSNTLENAAAKMFPSVGQEQEKQAWLAQQAEQEAKRQNAVDVANTKGVFGNENARIKAKAQTDVGAGHDTAKVKSSENYSAARVEQAQKRLEAAIASDERKSGDSAANRAARALFTKVQDRGYNSLDDREKELYQKVEAQLGGAAAPQAKPPTGKAPAAPTSVAPQQSSQDQAALAWANANSSDPRAAKIKQRLGVQ